MCCPGAPRRSGPAPAIINQRTSQNSGKTSESGETNVAANPMGPSGAPSALRGPQCFAKAHIENPWENKGERRFLQVPLCYVRDGIRGGLIPVIINKNRSKRCKKQVNLENSRYPTNPMRPNGVTGAPRGPQSSAKAHVENYWKTKENKGSLRCTCVMRGMGSEGNDSRTTTDLLRNSSQSSALVMC